MTGTEPALLIGSFIYDEEHRTTGVVEEFREGLVRYRTRTALGSARQKEYWTSEPCCYVLLENFPRMSPEERLLADFFSGHTDRFLENADGTLDWEDEDGNMHKIRLEVLND